jgi:hypothetical protein
VFHRSRKRQNGEPETFSPGLPESLKDFKKSSVLKYSGLFTPTEWFKVIASRQSAVYR